MLTLFQIESHQECCYLLGRIPWLPDWLLCQPHEYLHLLPYWEGLEAFSPTTYFLPVEAAINTKTYLRLTAF